MDVVAIWGVSVTVIPQPDAWFVAMDFIQPAIAPAMR